MTGSSFVPVPRNQWGKLNGEAGPLWHQCFTSTERQTLRYDFSARIKKGPDLSRGLWLSKRTKTELAESYLGARVQGNG